MAITVKLYRKGAIKRRQNGTRHGTIEYMVRSDTVAQDQDAIADDPNLPQIHVTGHPDNATMICREIETEEWDESDLFWIVTATFDNEVNADDPVQQITEEITTGGMRGFTENVPTFWDTFGNPLVNSADDYYEGLTRRKRLVAVPVSTFFTTIPWPLFGELNGTVNAGPVTIHGITFPAGMCLLEDPQMADTPIIKDGDDNLYWRVSYTVTINPAGWLTILPNRGFKCWQYQTRTEKAAGPPRTFNSWRNVDFGDYDTETDDELKRRIKVRIVDDADTDVPENLWLNRHGEKFVGSLVVVEDTGSMTEGSTSLTGLSTVTADDIGKYIVVVGAGLNGRNHHSRINNFSGSTATLVSAAKTSVTSAAVKVGGAWAQSYQIEDLADWTGLPLPNNHV